MAVYLVTWDLNREKPNYSDARNRVVTHLQRYDHTKDSGLDSVWFLSTNSTAQQINDDLRKVFDDNDRFMIVRMSGTDRQGWLAKSTWEWINARL